jgi:soluble lytic murein transglycosylase-like protein
MYLFRGLGAATSGAADLLTSLAPNYGVPPSLALAVANQESGLNQGAVSSAGAIGVMQLEPATAADLGVNPNDLAQNIQGGLQYLSQMYQQFGNWFDALVAYNAGPSKAAAGTAPASSSQYASSILSAAGIDSTPSVPAADLSAIQPVDLSSLVPSSGLSTAAWVALALAAVGVAVWASA